MALSKRFFNTLALRFNGLRGEYDDDGAAMWIEMVHATADAIAEESPTFDRARFLKACREGLPARRSPVKSPK